MKQEDLEDKNLLIPGEGMIALFIPGHGLIPFFKGKDTIRIVDKNKTGCPFISYEMLEELSKNAKRQDYFDYTGEVDPMIAEEEFRND